MTRGQLEELEAALTELVNERRSLGDFDTNSRTIRMMAEALLMLTRHLLEEGVKNAKGKQRKR